MQEAIIQLLEITARLKVKYDRRFTLDGKLVGDIGEALAKEYYNIELLPENTPKYDAVEIGTNRQVQIKSTMKTYFTFPFGEPPAYLLAIKILDTGKIVPIYNGPGSIIEKYIKDNNLKSYRNSYYSFTLSKFSELNELVDEKDRIKEKIYIPTLKEIAERNPDLLKLPEGINPNDYDDTDEDERNGTDITYPQPDWMEKLLDENDKDEKA